jgi:Tol biopolymer transport system component
MAVMTRSLRAALLGTLLLTSAHAGVVDRVSAPPNALVLGRQANASSQIGATSAASVDGRYVVFISDASNLVAGAVGGHVYLADLVMNTLRRITPDGGAGRVAQPTISADGRWIAFRSPRDELVPNDTNGTDDIYLYDSLTAALTRVSSNPQGAAGDYDSDEPSLSFDGRYVAYSSYASDLVPGDTGDKDVFLYDRIAGTTTIMSIGPNGPANDDADDPRMSPNARYICFDSFATNLVAGDTNDERDVFRHDRTNGETLLVSRTPGGAPGNHSSTRCAVADDGTVAFISYATDLVPGAGRNDGAVYVYDPDLPALELASVAANGAPANGPSRDVSISSDGARIAFQANATNLPGPPIAEEVIYVRDRGLHQTFRASRAADPQASPDGRSFQGRMVPTGTQVVFYSEARNLVAGDTNNSADVFRYDYIADYTQRISIAPSALASGGGGAAGRPSGDGSRVVYLSNEPSLLAPSGAAAMQVFLYRRADRTQTLVSRTLQGLPTTDFLEEPDISADGRWIVYASRASDLATGTDTNNALDVFLYDVANATTKRISSNAMGNAPATGLSRRATISADGSRVAFFSTQAELGAVGTYGSVLLWTRSDGTIRRIDLAADGSIGNSLMDGPRNSGDGHKITFRSIATNLLPGVDNGRFQIYRKDLDGGALDLVSHGIDGNEGDSGSVTPSISRDGSIVAFASLASNLVAGDDAQEDIFVANFGAGGAITRITPGGAGTGGVTSMSADGRYIAFSSTAALVAGDTNTLSDAYVYDRLKQTTERASVDAQGRELLGASNDPRLSADGSALTFAIYPADGVLVPGRYASIDADVLLATDPQIELFANGFESP